VNIAFQGDDVHPGTGKVDLDSRDHERDEQRPHFECTTVVVGNFILLFSL